MKLEGKKELKEESKIWAGGFCWTGLKMKKIRTNKRNERKKKTKENEKNKRERTTRERNNLFSFSFSFFLFWASLFILVFSLSFFLSLFCFSYVGEGCGGWPLPRPLPPWGGPCFVGWAGCCTAIWGETWTGWAAWGWKKTKK